MNPPLNISFRAAVVRQICLLLDANTPLYQSIYMTWLRYEVMNENQETGPAFITDLELANLGNGIALMHAFEEILGIEHIFGVVTKNHPHLSFGTPAA
jgi:hypothetical protein